MITQLAREREEAKQKAEAEKAALKPKKVKAVESQEKKVFKSGVGKYINPASQ